MPGQPLPPAVTGSHRKDIGKHSGAVVPLLNLIPMIDNERLGSTNKVNSVHSKNGFCGIGCTIHSCRIALSDRSLFFGKAKVLSYGRFILLERKRRGFAVKPAKVRDDIRHVLLRDLSKGRS